MLVRLTQIEMLVYFDQGISKKFTHTHTSILSPGIQTIEILDFFFSQITGAQNLFKNLKYRRDFGDYVHQKYIEI